MMNMNTKMNHEDNEDDVSREWKKGQGVSWPWLEVWTCLNMSGLRTFFHQQTSLVIDIGLKFQTPMPSQPQPQPAALYSLASAYTVKAFGVGWCPKASQKDNLLHPMDITANGQARVTIAVQRSWRGEFRQRHLATALDFGRSPGDASERWDVFGDSAFVMERKVWVWKGRKGTKWQLPHFIDLSTGRITANCMIYSKPSAWEGGDLCQTWSFQWKRLVEEIWQSSSCSGNSVVLLTWT